MEAAPAEGGRAAEELVNARTHASRAPTPWGACGPAAAAGDASLNTVIVNYIPDEYGERELHELFFPFYPTTVRLAGGRSGYGSLGAQPRHQGYGFVHFSSRGDAEAAIAALNGRPAGNKRLKVTLAKPRDEVQFSTNLYVAGLPPRTSKDAFRRLCDAFGDVLECTVLPSAAEKASAGGAPPFTRGGAFGPGRLPSARAGLVRYARRRQADDAVAALDGVAVTEDLAAAAQPAAGTSSNSSSSGGGGGSAASGAQAPSEGAVGGHSDADGAAAGASGDGEGQAHSAGAAENVAGVAAAAAGAAAAGHSVHSMENGPRAAVRACVMAAPVERPGAPAAPVYVLTCRYATDRRTRQKEAAGEWLPPSPTGTGRADGSQDRRRWHEDSDGGAGTGQAGDGGGGFGARGGRHQFGVTLAADPGSSSSHGGQAHAYANGGASVGDGASDAGYGFDAGRGGGSRLRPPAAFAYGGDGDGDGDGVSGVSGAMADLRVLPPSGRPSDGDGASDSAGGLDGFRTPIEAELREAALPPAPTGAIARGASATSDGAMTPGGRVALSVAHHGLASRHDATSTPEPSPAHYAMSRRDSRAHGTVAQASARGSPVRPIVRDGRAGSSSSTTTGATASTLHGVAGYSGGRGSHGSAGSLAGMLRGGLSRHTNSWGAASADASTRPTALPHSHADVGRHHSMLATGMGARSRMNDNGGDGGLYHPPGFGPHPGALEAAAGRGRLAHPGGGMYVVPPGQEGQLQWPPTHVLASSALGSVAGAQHTGGAGVPSSASIPQHLAATAAAAAAAPANPHVPWVHTVWPLPSAGPMPSPTGVGAGVPTSAGFAVDPSGIAAPGTGAAHAAGIAGPHMLMAGYPGVGAWGAAGQQGEMAPPQQLAPTSAAMAQQQPQQQHVMPMMALGMPQLMMGMPLGPQPWQMVVQTLPWTMAAMGQHHAAMAQMMQMQQHMQQLRQQQAELQQEQMAQQRAQVQQASSAVDAADAAAQAAASPTPAAGPAAGFQRRGSQAGAAQ